MTRLRASGPADTALCVSERQAALDERRARFATGEAIARRRRSASPRSDATTEGDNEPPEPADIFAGRQLRVARLMASMSLQALAAEVGLSFQGLQKYENGTIRISASRLWTCAKVLNRPISWFFENPEPQHPDAPLLRELERFILAFEAVEDPLEYERVRGIIAAATDILRSEAARDLRAQQTSLPPGRRR